MAGLVEIALPVPLDRNFTYRVPDGLEHRVEIGRRVLVPFGKRSEVRGFVVGRPEVSPVPDAELRDVAAFLDDAPALGPEMMELCRFLARYYGCSLGEALDAALPGGVKRGRRSRRVLHLALVPPPEEARRAATAMPAGRYRQARLLTLLADAGEPLPLSLALRNAQIATASPAKSLVKAGLARFENLALPDDPLNMPAGPPPPPLDLTGEQAAAVREISAVVAAGTFATFLLYGITGSGKTEVYLRALTECVARGRQAIVMVPEISLTPQTAQRFRERFPRVAVLHSAQSDAERARYWRAVRDGQVDVVVGPRSAVFAPLPRLGLVVVDEEHDSSFKQGSTPRYHGRDLAVVRARMAGAAVVLGSATPALESWHNARAGKYRLLPLTARVGGGDLPPVEIVDMAREMMELKRAVWLSRRLRKLVADALTRGEQAMLFLNRRGFARSLFCRVCGTPLGCRACHLSLTYHQARNRAMCHLCGYEVRPPDLCPSCQSPGFRQRGFGTERIEEEVAEAFPKARVARMDSDTMTGRGAHERLLAKVGAREVDILVGTQMISKGLHFPDITVVGVLDADIGLDRPDFRATERTFQQVAQVAGRTGRGPKGGRVVVQTFRPALPAIVAAASHDFVAFAEQELRDREAAWYPPYCRILLATYEGRAENEVAARARADAVALERAFAPEEARVLGPAAPSVDRVKGRYRRQVVLKARGPAEVSRAVRALRSTPRTAGVDLALDVDPADFG